MNAMAPTPMNWDYYTNAFVQLRDKKKAIQDRHKEELAPINAVMDKLEARFLQNLLATGQDSAASASGTVYITTKRSASLADAAAFMAYVIESDNFDLLDRKANVKAVEDHIAKFGNAPPGVNYTETAEVGIRRKSGK